MNAVIDYHTNALQEMNEIIYLHAIDFREITAVICHHANALQ